jgi:16S rRNA (guanine527-N7)-methyltransferase
LQILNKSLNDLNIHITEEEKDKLKIFFEEISYASKQFNLTGLSGWEDIRDTLFIRSFRYSSVIDKFFNKDQYLELKNIKILDLGTGAGIPSIPLKILYPNMDIKLVDSSKKKCLFVESIIKKLNLKNISIENTRAELLGVSTERESYDIVLTRALAKLPTLAELTIPLIKKNGIVVTAKGLLPSEELKDSEYILNLLGSSKSQIIKIIKPNYISEDNFIIWVKNKKTHKKFPRRNGVPKKDPIIK